MDNEINEVIVLLGGIADRSFRGIPSFLKHGNLRKKLMELLRRVVNFSLLIHASRTLKPTRRPPQRVRRVRKGPWIGIPTAVVLHLHTERLHAYSNSCAVSYQASSGIEYCLWVMTTDRTWRALYFIKPSVYPGIVQNILAERLLMSR